MLTIWFASFLTAKVNRENNFYYTYLHRASKYSFMVRGFLSLLPIYENVVKNVTTVIIAAFNRCSFIILLVNTAT